MEKRDLKIYATNLIKLKELRNSATSLKTTQQHVHGALSSNSSGYKKKAVLCTTL